jgi:hypothetical protein
MPSPAETVAARYAQLPEVIAIGLAGSRATGAAGQDSDYDLYIFSEHDLGRETRAHALHDLDPRAELSGDQWGPGDEWEDPASGAAIDAVYWTTGWMEGALDRILVRHEPSTGYSTCFLHSIRACQPIHDPSGWLARLKEKAAQPYPEELREAIVRHNHPILRGARSAYRVQIGKAVGRDDLVSINHRVAAYLASYFDIIFAVNRVPHPGEKRLLDLAEATCPARPHNMRESVTRLVRAGKDEVMAAIDQCSDGLDELLRAEGLLG